MNLLLPALFALVHADAVLRPPPEPAVMRVAADEDGGVRRVPIKKQPVDKQQGTPEPTQPKGRNVPTLPRSTVPSSPGPPPAPPPSHGGGKGPTGPDNLDCKRGTGQTGWDGCR